jgi:hypothetical protein
VLAFMRPMWLSAEAQQAAGRGAAVVIILDASASTGQLHDGVSAIRSMRADADRVLDSLMPGKDHANIIHATARPYTALGSMTTNIAALRSELSELGSTYERADLVGALSLAGRILVEHDGPRRLVIASDLQASNWEDALKRLGHDVTIPADTRVTVLPPKHQAPANLSLQAPSVYPPIPRAGQPVSLSVKLTNHSDRTQPATVRVSVAGQPVDSQSLTIEPGEQRAVAFMTTFDQPGDHKATFSLPADGLAADDTCYLVTRAVAQTPVILITDDDTDRPGSAGYFLVRAISPYGDARDRYNVKIVRSDDPAWPPLAGTAAVLLGETGLLPDERLAALLQYTMQGGGVDIFCGDGPVGENLAALNRLKPDMAMPWLPAVPHKLDRSDEPLVISDGNWRSPLLKQFGEAAQIALSQVRFRHAWAGGEVNENAHAALGYSDGTPALVWRDLGAGRLTIANLGVAAHHSDLGKHGLFVALMQGLIDAMQNTHNPAINNTVGQAVSLTSAQPINRQGPTPRVYHPDGRTPVDTTLALGDHTSGIIIGSPDTPGFYTAQQGDTVLGTAAVNLDPRESDLSRITADKLIAAFQSNYVRADAPDNRANSAGPLPTYHGRDLFGWLLIGALTLFGFEVFLLGYWRR